MQLVSLLSDRRADSKICRNPVYTGASWLVVHALFLGGSWLEVANAQCPAGREEDASGTCVDCPVGKFQPAASGSACVMCGAGSQPETGGVYDADGGAEACTPCARGRYKSAADDNYLLLGRRLFTRNASAAPVLYHDSIGLIDSGGWSEIYDHPLHVDDYGALQFDADGDGADDLYAFRFSQSSHSSRASLANTLYTRDESAPGGYVEAPADSHPLIMSRAGGGSGGKCCNSKGGLLFDADGDGAIDLYVFNDHNDPNQLFLRNTSSVGVLDRYSEVPPNLGSTGTGQGFFLTPL
jgi:hypothetical protein